MNDVFTIWDAFIPILLCFYGYKLLKNTPEYGDKNGLYIKRAIKSRAAWELAHKFGGKLILGYGIFMALLFIVKEFLIKTDSQVLTWGYIVIGLLFTISIVPIVNIKLKKTFGDSKK